GKVLSAATSYSPNQFLTVLLEGPRYKRFQMQWLLSPRNPTESKNLNLILNRLRNAASPSLAANNLLFKFPKIFQLVLQPNSQYVVKFKPAVVENIVIEYTAAGAPSFFRPGNDGISAPTHIGLTLALLELEFWLAGNFQDNNDPLDVHRQSDMSTIGGLL